MHEAPPTPKGSPVPSLTSSPSSPLSEGSPVPPDDPEVIAYLTRLLASGEELLEKSEALLKVEAPRYEKSPQKSRYVSDLGAAVTKGHMIKSELKVVRTEINNLDRKESAKVMIVHIRRACRELEIREDEVKRWIRKTEITPSVGGNGFSPNFAPSPFR